MGEYNLPLIGKVDPIKTLTNLTTIWGKAKTSWSYNFLFSNFQRDTQAGIGLFTSDYGPKAGLTAGANVINAQKGIYDYINGKDSDWSGYYKEYLENGGRVGWYTEGGFEAKYNGLLEELAKLDKNSPEYFNTIGNFVEKTNEIVEGGIRLSVYKQLRDMGKSTTESANYSKNLTVNFNKKGEVGSVLNLFWKFSNPSIQGNKRFLEQFGKFKYDPKTKTRAWKWNKVGMGVISAFATAGFAMSHLQRSIDPDFDENYSKWEQDNNWIFPIPGEGKANDIAIPFKLPYGFNIPFVIGSMMEKSMYGNADAGEFLRRTSTATLTAFSPIGGNSFYPTLLQFIDYAKRGVGWHGERDRPQQQGDFGQQQVPYSTLYYQDDDELAVKFAKWLNESTGGTDMVSGAIDVSPQDMENTFNHLVGGGTLNDIKDIYSTFETIYNKEYDLEKIMIINKFVTSPSKSASQSAMWDAYKFRQNDLLSVKDRNSLFKHWGFLKDKFDFDEEKFTELEYKTFIDKIMIETLVGQRIAVESFDDNEYDVWLEEVEKDLSKLSEQQKYEFDLQWTKHLMRLDKDLIEIAKEGIGSMPTEVRFSDDQMYRISEYIKYLDDKMKFHSNQGQKPNKELNEHYTTLQKRANTTLRDARNLKKEILKLDERD